MLPRLSLVLGGANSGKSVVAENMLSSVVVPRVYIATAQGFDDEVRAKIERHRSRRGTGWTTVEAPLDLAAPLATASPDVAILIDCVTLWLSNLLLHEVDLASAEDGLLGALAACRAPVVVVSNEVGQGVVPDTALGRQFRSAQGRLNQRLAAQADLVVGVMAGLPFVLKGQLPESPG